MIIEKEDFLVNSAGLGIAGVVGVGCSKAVKWGYGSLITHIQGVDPTIAKAVVESRLGNVSMVYTVPESVLSGVQKVLKISGSAGQRGAFGAGVMETIWNFQKTWVGQGSPSILRNTLEGGLRGTAYGFFFGGFFNREAGYYKLVQFATGATIGCAVGMVGACIGTVTGLGLKKAFAKQESK